MTARKIMPLVGVVLALAMLAAPVTASAFKIVKVTGGAITKHTEIHFTLDTEFNYTGGGFKVCEINGTITTKDGEEATTSVINGKLITNNCVGWGVDAGCKIKADLVDTAGKFIIDENSFTFPLVVKTDVENCGAYTTIDYTFKPVQIIVGTGKINVGIIEGKGGTADSNQGAFAVSASGEMTLGQYTENGVNQGSAKGVFKIE